MLYYDRIDISEGIDLANSNSSKECMVCQNCFFNHWFKFQDSIWNGYHNLTVFCLNISNIVIVSAKGVAYRCIIQNISKSEAINLVKFSVLDDRG